MAGNTLRQINDDLMQLMLMMEDEDYDQQTIADTFEAVAGEREEKLNGYGVIRGEVKANIEKVDAEIKRLQARKKTLENNLKSLDWAVENSMRLTGDMKIKTEYYTFSIVKNGGKAPLIIDEGITTDDVDAEYIKWGAPSFNTDYIRERLDAGDEIPWARYGERGESLRVK